MGKFVIDTLCCRMCGAHSNDVKLLDLQDPHTIFAEGFCSIISALKGTAIIFVKDKKYMVCLDCMQLALTIYDVKKRDHNIRVRKQGTKVNQICNGYTVGKSDSTTTSTQSLHIPSSNNHDSCKTKVSNFSSFVTGNNQFPMKLKAANNLHVKYHKSIDTLKEQYPSVSFPQGIEQYDWDPKVYLDGNIVNSHFAKLVSHRQSRRLQGEYAYRSDLYTMKEVPFNISSNDNEHKMLFFSSLHLVSSKSKNNLLQLVNIQSSVNSEGGLEKLDHAGCEISKKSLLNDDESIVNLDLEDLDGKFNSRSDDDLNSSLLQVLRSEDAHICKLCCRVFASISGLRRHETCHENWKKRSKNLKFQSKEIVIPLLKMEEDKKIIQEWPTAIGQFIRILNNEEELKYECIDITEENNSKEKPSISFKQTNEAACSETLKSIAASENSTEEIDSMLNKCEKCITTVKHNVIFRNFSAHTCLCKPNEKCTEPVSPELNPYSPMSVQFSVTDCYDLSCQHSDNNDIDSLNECALNAALCVNSAKTELYDEMLYIRPMLKRINYVNRISKISVDKCFQTKNIYRFSHFPLTLYKTETIISNLASHLEIFSHITVAATEHNILDLSVSLSYEPGKRVSETDIDITQWTPITYEYLPCRTITRNGQMYDIQEIRKMKIKTNNGKIADVISLEIGH